VVEADDPLGRAHRRVEVGVGAQRRTDAGEPLRARRKDAGRSGGDEPRRTAGDFGAVQRPRALEREEHRVVERVGQVE
jgi:hypothetical protein